MINGVETLVRLEPVEHRYFHVETGAEYSSVSKVKKSYKEPFQEQVVAYAMAKKKLKLQHGEGNFDGDEIRKVQVEILQDWKKRNERAIDVGMVVDAAIDEYFNTGKMKQGMEQMLKGLGELMSGYQRRITKAIVWSNTHMVAGEIDKLCLRKKGSVADYYDYKTNLYKGMQYISKGGNFMKKPIDYLEDHNYHDLCLQLSIYALLGEICYNLKPGKLTGVLIDTENNYFYKLIPVPYMKHTAWAMLEDWRKSINKEDNF